MSLKPLNSLPKTDLTIKRALLSVSDKQGIAELGQALSQQGIELISTGGTAKALRDAELPVTDVKDITQFKECLDGRVKTLHPNIHAGILARTSHKPDVKELENLQIEPIQLVVVNLYPFQETVASGDATLAVATENIDIGGPTMVRAAAKNFAHVSVLTHPGQYDEFISELSGKSVISFSTRQKLARQAFEHTAGYDAAISSYFNDLEKNIIPGRFTVSLKKSGELRYGENPHQQAGVYGNQNSFIDCFHGKQLSYNNYLDLDSALRLAADFSPDKPLAAIFKHTVPCGVARADSLKEAYQKAFSTDRTSPFGGIVCCNQTLDADTASVMDDIFTEIIMAPDFTDEAKELLMKKKNRRLVRILTLPDSKQDLSYRSIFGGALVQQENHSILNDEDIEIPTKREPTTSEMEDLKFAWRVVKHVKSNAVVYARDLQTVGIGTGQPSRVDSSELAIQKSKKEGLSLKKSVLASDAFFPFSDGVEAAAKAGATAIIQPGGSIRDKEVIKTADNNNITMIFTGTRHFRH